jgi:predicted nucleic acid-binding protein
MDADCKCLSWWTSRSRPSGFYPTERGSFANSILERVAREGAHVPALFVWEIQNVLLSAERAARATLNEVDEALEALASLPIFVEAVPERPRSGIEVSLVRHYRLTSSYLALAAHRRIALATCDAKLARASRDVGIMLLAP